jgi:hypothetical protein
MKKIKLQNNLKQIKLLNSDTGNQDNHLSLGDSAKKANYDENMICVEIYNNNNFDVVFSAMKIIGTHPLQVHCKAYEWCFLPHQYYLAHNKHNAHMELTKNFGSAKFRGIK